ncbi:recombination regulator RecX [Treponema sp. OMZ 792]|uniref:recombination regulator RecX n=1 Tax=unclassified Treponema TaxID=2638727 RepID=UPI0020A24CF5|nr:recombination regulator RecX [Treponema sp. OMZ 799]UTC76392.1 recombination regulator RecX [Treponema sp. OMZ 792]UTC78763.1 recombination regulator RecX [Treponema sp. OMZ 799]UTC81571.1 recombination regulator RecX [Treponema sp. OMZ 798]
MQDEDSSSASVNPFSIADICSTSSDLVKIINSEGVSFVTRPNYFDEDDFDGLVGECGCPISEESLDALLNAVRIYEAECAAAAYLYRAEHSRFQLDLKLRKKGFLASEINPALDYLTGKGLLDDRRFAVAWLNTRVISKKEGRNRLASELALRGVSFKIVEDVLNEFFSEHSEEELCRKALEKQLINGLDKPRLMQKMYRLGFSVSTVNICLEGIENITDSF